MEDVQITQLQVPFLSLMAVIAIVAMVMSRLSLPDIEGTKAEKGEKLEKSVWSFRHLTLGVVAVFFYVGVEVCVGANILLYSLELEAKGRIFSFFFIFSLTISGINFSIPALMATLY
jgi:FHS family L-fucose permease-like MFS transporter